MPSKLDPLELDIRALVQEGYSQRQLAKQFGVSRDTVQRWLASHDLEIAAVSQVEYDDAISREELLESEVKDLRSRVKKGRTSSVLQERLIEEVRAAVQVEPVKFEPLPPIVNATHHGHVQVLMLSDTHVGEVVDLEAMDGINEYCWDICTKRMQNIQRSLASYRDARPYPISEFHHWWLGDMVNGDHHKELAETNEFGKAEQAYRVGMMLGQFAEQLVPHYPKQVVYAVPGNHARMDKQPASKRVFDSFDWLAYKIASTYLHAYIEAGAIEFHAPYSGYVVAETAGMKHLLWHGDGVKSSMVGFPGGGVIRRTKELNMQWLQKGVVLDGHAIGHFHQAHVLPGNVYVNGSVKGPDEWTLKTFGSSSAPEQLLLTFDPEKRRRTDVSSINP